MRTLSTHEYSGEASGSTEGRPARAKAGLETIQDGQKRCWCLVCQVRSLLAHQHHIGKATIVAAACTNVAHAKCRSTPQDNSHTTVNDMMLLCRAQLPSAKLKRLELHNPILSPHKTIVHRMQSPTHTVRCNDDLAAAATLLACAGLGRSGSGSFPSRIPFQRMAVGRQLWATAVVGR